MKLVKGLIKDLNDIDIPEGGWKYARNAMYVQQGALSNELGFDRLHERPDKILIGNIPLPDDRVILFYVNEFITGGVYLGSEIGILRENNTYTTLILDNRLNFNPNYPINGKFKFNNKTELIIVFTDDFNPPRLINLKTTNLPITLGSEKDFNLFLNLNVSRITNAEVRNGGNLLSGTYQFAFRYRFKDGSVTGVYFISNTIPVFVSNSNVYHKVEGDEAGKQTSKSIRLDITDIDMDYEKLMVYVIKTIGQVTTADLIGEYFISSTDNSLVYTGSQGTPVALSEILTSFSSYSKIKKFEVHQDWLYGANVATTEIEVNGQSVANGIVVKWNAENSVSIDKVKNSYKDPTTVFIKRGFMPGEVYALYIRFVLKNGQRTTAYHIPGRAPLEGETDNVVFTYLQKIDPTAKNFHLVNTAQIDPGEAKGLMGYWENETEKYPDVTSWGSRRNQPVKHHRFPDIAFLTTELGPLINVPVITPLSRTGSFPTFNDDNNPQSLYVSSFPTGSGVLLSSTLTLFGFSGEGTRTYNNVSYIAPETAPYNFVVNYLGSITEQNSLPIPLGYLRFIVYRGTEANPTQEILAARNTSLTIPSDFATINQTFEVIGLNLNAGDRISLVAMIDLNIEANTYLVSVNTTLDITPNLPEEETSTNMKILGLELSNINIIEGISEKIQGYEILYAQKGLENSQVIGQGLLTPQNWHAGEDNAVFGTSGRFYSFDMLNLKPATGATHMKFLKTYGVTDASDILNVTTEYNAVTLFQTELQKVDTIEYVPNNNTAVTPTNELREEYIHVTFAENLPVIFDPRNFVCELHSLKKDVYLHFNEQVLVSTGIIHKLNIMSSVQQTGLFFGGDTFASPYGVNLHFKNGAAFIYRTINLWSFSASNIGLRTSLKEWNKKYYPIAGIIRGRWNLISNEEIPAEVDQNNAIAVQAAKEDLVMRSTDLYLYNIDYSRLNSLIQGMVFIDNIPVSEYPFRLIRGLPAQRESEIETWRSFPAFDYYEMPKEKGEIWNIASIGSVLLIHQKYMLYRTRGNGVLTMKSNEEIQLGEGDILDFRPEEVIPQNLSYAGTQSMYACIVCKMGYVFVDGSQGRIFVFSSELKEISNKYMMNWFNINFLYTGTDNPYTGSGFTMAYDNRYNRLVIGFNSISKRSTISFSNYIDAWVSFHTYYPGVLFDTPNKLLSVLSRSVAGDRALYIHNSPNKRGIYYNQEGSPEFFIVDAVSSVNQTLTKKTVSVSWIADRLRNGSLQRDKTFTGIFLHNSFQATQQFTLTHYDFVSGTVRNMKNSWNFDSIRNIGNGNVPISDQGNVITSNLNNSKPWYEREEFEDKYIVIRLIYNNQIIEGVQEVMFLYDVSANDIPKKR